jgi:hypothetical protein
LVPVNPDKPSFYTDPATGKQNTFQNTSVVYNKKKKTWGGAFIAFTSGILCANYVTPVITHSLGLDGEKMERGMAFILGFIGLQGVEYMINKYFPKKSDA